MAIEFQRVHLDGTSWVDVARGFLQSRGVDVDEALSAVLGRTRWRPSRIYRFDHWVEENRLGSWWRPGLPVPHPAVIETHRALQHHYGVSFPGFGIIQYRDGRDGQAFHRDRDLRWCDDTLIGILTLGAQRPWLLRPRPHRNDHALERKGATHDLRPAAGDLFVMGGRTQADWEHSVPPVPGPVGVRVSFQWRWTSKRGEPEVGGSYRAPRHYAQGRSTLERRVNRYGGRGGIR